MVRKFATILALTVMVGPRVRAQQTQTPAAQDPSTTQQPAATQQTPDAQSSSSQDATEEDTIRRRRMKPRDFNKWSYNFGAGGDLTNGTTKTFAKSGGYVGAAGVARNANRYLGLRLDFAWSQLPLRDSALEMAQAPSASSHVYSLNLGPVFNIPVTKQWGGYIVIGPSYYHRSGKLDSSAAVPGGPCNPFWDWWGRCSANSIALNGSFVGESLNQFGEFFGGGVTRKLTGKYEIYAEYRFEHGTHRKITTDYRPITIGVRF